MLYSPARMHIPDGFLSGLVALAAWAISLGVLSYALRRVGRELGERQAPLMGVLAACIFAGQMLNFTVAGGTSGHLMGAALATILLGPWAAVLVMTSVVSIQALVFQDGGLLALGANVFNMAILAPAVAYFTFSTARRLAGGGRRGLYAGGFAAGWLSVLVAALAVALQLALSGTSPANLAIPAMAVVHALIGLGEGLITLGALVFLRAARPDLVSEGRGVTAGGRVVWVFGLLLAVGLAILSPLASAHPDGLERVAGRQGFLALARGPMWKLVPDYVLPGIANQASATVAAGILGVVLVSSVAFGAAHARRRRRVVAE